MNLNSDKFDIEEQLSRNLCIMTYPCILVNQEGKIIDCNQSFLSLSYYQKGEFLNRNVFLFLNLDMTSLVEFSQSLSTEKYSTIISWYNRVGERKQSQLQPIFIPYDKRTYAYIQFLPKAHTLLNYFSDQLFSRSHLGFILLDNEANVVKITDIAATILGGSKNEYKGQNLLKHFEKIPDDQQIIQHTFFEGVSVRNKAMSWNNGEMEYELLIDSFPVFNSENQLLGVSVFIKDVTNIRSLENQIRRNDRLAMIGQIAAGTAHEIRNPLTSIRGFLQMLRGTFEELGFVKEIEFTGIMLEEIDRINHLVGEFLLLSRSRETTFVKISLEQLMNQFLPIIQNEALLNGINVFHDSFSNLPLVVGDKELLKQVFLNICKNAIESMGNEGELRITHHLLIDEGMISIDFEDNGPGIPPYVLDKIFDPFFTTKEEGTGLGLSVCQRIIHDMGGKIRVSSKGFRTTFHVQIPYVSNETIS